jgi:predicted nucleic acid-binding protein
MKYRLKLPDAIIAATCYYLDLPLVSADKIFSKVEEITLIRFAV